MESYRLDKLVFITCRYFNITQEALKTKTRKRDVIYPRQVFEYIAAENKLAPLSIVGARHNKDHATVLHSKRLIANLLTYDINVNLDVHAITDAFFERDQLPVIMNIIRRLKEDELTDLLQYLKKYDTEKDPIARRVCQPRNNPFDGIRTRPIAI